MKEKSDNEIKEVKPKLTFMSNWRNKKKHQAILIHIFHKNGNMSHSVVKGSGRTFELLSFTYIIDEELMFYDTIYKQKALFYVEGMPLPIKIQGINRETYKLKIDSQSLTSVIKMEYVELLTKVAKVKDKLALILMMVFINSGLTLVSVLILLKTSGIIK